MDANEADKSPQQQQQQQQQHPGLSRATSQQSTVSRASTSAPASAVTPVESWVPTQDWVAAWKSRLPLQTIMRLLQVAAMKFTLGIFKKCMGIFFLPVVVQVLVPQVEKICIDKGLTDESEILRFLQHGTLVLTYMRWEEKKEGGQLPSSPLVSRWASCPSRTRS